MNEIIKLPIDLSCISEKLLNKLAVLTPPNILATTKDKKEKILHKLYKRRVEVDFSRKATTKNSKVRSIASCLTCCMHCGTVYLENYEEYLHCTEAKAFVDFRGKVCFYHFSIPNWSLTSYLKTLHAGGMNWEAIYWHVWAACQVFRIGKFAISALETDKYRLVEDGIIFQLRYGLVLSGFINCSIRCHSSAFYYYINSGVTGSQLQSENREFSADSIDIMRSSSLEVKLLVTSAGMNESSQGTPLITETLNPLRSSGVLPACIFELLQSQMKLIAGLAHKHLIEATGSAIVKSSSSMKITTTGYGDLLWGESESGEIFARGRTRTFVHNPTIARAISSDSANIDSGSDCEAPLDGALRSRSVSVGPTRRKKGNVKRNASTPSLTDSGKSMNILTKPTDVVTATDGTVDIEKTSRLGILKGLPPSLSKCVKAREGSVHGLWMSASPLQIFPTSFWGQYVSISDCTHISEGKQNEWRMDIIREFDEKRFERLESFALSKRHDILADMASTKFASKRPSATISTAVISAKYGSEYYYKDRGRQAYKVTSSPPS